MAPPEKKVTSVSAKYDFHRVFDRHGKILPLEARSVENNVIYTTTRIANDTALES